MKIGFMLCSAMLGIVGISGREVVATEIPSMTSEGSGVIRYQEVIPTIYEDGLEFSQGMAAVKQNGKWGYLNELGQVVIDFQYDHVGSFQEGLAIVGKEEESGLAIGFINKTGEYTPFSVETVVNNVVTTTNYVQNSYGSKTNLLQETAFHQGHVVLGKYIFDVTGAQVKSEILVQGNYNEGYYVVNGGEVGHETIFTLDGAVVDFTEMATVSEYSEMMISEYQVNQGLLPLWYQKDRVRQLGFYDVKKMEWHIEPQYNRCIYDFENGTEVFFGETGLAMVMDDTMKYGGINKENEVVIPFLYDELHPFSYGLAVFRQGEFYGFMDTSGNVVVEPNYIQVTSYSDLGLAVALTEEYVVILDTKGNPVEGFTEIDINAYLGFNENGSLVADAPNHWMRVERNGEVGYGKIEYTPPLPSEEEMSFWAVPFVVEGIESNIIPVSMQYSYEMPINRGDFAKLLMYGLSTMKSSDLEEIVLKGTGVSLQNHIWKYSFLDTTEEEIVAAFALGLVSGKGSGKFDPYSFITREEAAVMLKNFCDLLGISEEEVQSLQVSDEENISFWALDSVSQVVSLNIMGTTGGNKFSPQGIYTKEQAYITLGNIFQLAVV